MEILQDNLGLLIMLGIVTYLFWVLFRSHEKVLLTNKIISESDGKFIFVCNDIEELGNDLIQFYGAISGGDNYPGVSKVNINGNKFTIFEIYADGQTPNIPSKVGKDGTNDTAMVIKESHFNFKSLKYELKMKRVITFQLI